MTFVVIEEMKHKSCAHPRAGWLVFGEPVTSYLLYNGSASSSV